MELPPVAYQKRKRRHDTTSTPSTAQPPNQPSSKRRKKVKSTADAGAPTTGPTEPVPTTKATKRAANRPGRPPKSVREAERQTCQQGNIREKDDTEPQTSGTGVVASRNPLQVDLTQDSDSSEDEAVRRPQPAASQDAGDEDADSRYALGSRRKGRPKKPAVSTAGRTAELKFEDDGLEEVDKAEAAVAGAGVRASSQNNKRGPQPGTPINAVNSGRLDGLQIQQANGKGKGKAKQIKIAPPTGVPSKVVMFTVIEAIAALSLYKGGTMSIPTEIDPQSRQPYEPLQAGDYLSYPVKGTYHLGALGRYGIDTIPPSPFSLTVPLSEHFFIQHTRDTSTAEPSRHGIGFSSALPARPKAPAVRRPNNYCFTFGRYRGRRMDSVPISYLRSILNSDDYHKDTKLQQAFADLYPKGLYESEVESYTFEKGGFKGKRLDEVPKSYLWGLLRKKEGGELVGGKKGRGRLERALEVWEKGQLDLTKD